MIIWIGMFIFIVGLRLFMGPLNTEKQKRTYLTAVGCVLAMLFALRGENYGGVYDLRVYMDFFERIADTPWSSLSLVSEFEIGFAVLNKLLSYLSHSGRTIILFHAVFCIYSVCRFIYKNTKEVFWAFLFFYSLGNMGFFLTGLRQAIAISVCLFAVEKAKEKKLVHFALIVLIAYLIHKSALVFAVMYLFLRLNAIRRNKWMIALPIALMLVFSPNIIQLGQFFSDEVQAAETAKFTFNGIVPILIYAITLAGQILFVKSVKTSENSVSSLEQRDSYVGFSMTAIGFGLYFLRFYNMALERISFYFLQGNPVALADVIGCFKRDRYEKVFEMAIVALCFLLFLRRLSNASYADYIFMWETV